MNCEYCDMERARIRVQFIGQNIYYPEGTQRDWQVCGDCFDSLRDDEEEGKIHSLQCQRIRFATTR